MSELTSPSWPLSDGWVVFLMSSSTRWWLAFPWWAQYWSIIHLDSDPDQPSPGWTTNSRDHKRQHWKPAAVPVSPQPRDVCTHVRVGEGGGLPTPHLRPPEGGEEREQVQQQVGQGAGVHEHWAAAANIPEPFLWQPGVVGQGQAGQAQTGQCQCLVQTFLHTNWENNTKTRRIEGSSSRGNSTVKIFLFYTISRGNLRRFFLEQVSRDGAILSLKWVFDLTINSAHWLGHMTNLRSIESRFNVSLKLDEDVEHFLAYCRWHFREF